jgi:hypothetical protein
MISIRDFSHKRPLGRYKSIPEAQLVGSELGAILKGSCPAAGDAAVG